MAYKLTEKRLKKAESILDAAFSLLIKNKAKEFLPRSFELDLCECWNVGYKELKFIMLDMLSHEKYKYLAVRYMEHTDGTGVKVEFQRHLADIHGVSEYNRLTYDKDRELFWNGFISRYCS